MQNKCTSLTRRKTAEAINLLCTFRAKQRNAQVRGREGRCNLRCKQCACQPVKPLRSAWCCHFGRWWTSLFHPKGHRGYTWLCWKAEKQKASTHLFKKKTDWHTLRKKQHSYLYTQTCLYLHAQPEHPQNDLLLAFPFHSPTPFLQPTPPIHTHFYPLQIL